MDVIRSVGHGTLGPDDLVTVLREADVDAIADVRRFPGSRRFPHVEREAMERWLPEADIDYQWFGSLGGRRRVHPESRNIGLRNKQFRAYADHMTSDEFAQGLAELRAWAEGRSVAVMCAESVWWRCHRRLLADHLVMLDDTRVEHLFHDGRLTAHEATAEARVDDGEVVYDVVEQPSLFH